MNHLIVVVDCSGPSECEAATKFQRQVRASDGYGTYSEIIGRKVARARPRSMGKIASALKVEEVLLKARRLRQARSQGWHTSNKGCMDQGGSGGIGRDDGPSAYTHTATSGRRAIVCGANGGGSDVPPTARSGMGALPLPRIARRC